MTTIDQGFMQHKSGMLDWLTSLTRSKGERRNDRVIPDNVPLHLDVPALPGFRQDSTVEEASDDGHRPLSISAMAAPIKPISLRRDSIYSAFNTALPVTDRHGLAGRNSELEKLVEAIVVQRKHAVIFGTRGSGKTSLARVFGDLADEAGCVALYASASGEAMKAAINWIKSIASDPEVGHIYEGTVVKVMDFGAFVNFFGAKDGLVHISQLAPRRVQKVTEVVKEGDRVKVKLLGFDERGKVRLSMKAVDQTTGEDLEAKQKVEAEQGRAEQQREVVAGAE